MSELITLQKSELLSLLRQAYEQGWLGYRELAESEVDYLLDEYLKKNPGNTYPAGGGNGSMPPPMSSYVMATPPSVATGRDNDPNFQIEVGDVPQMELGDVPDMPSNITISGSGLDMPNANGNVYRLNSDGAFGNFGAYGNPVSAFGARSSSTSSASSSRSSF